MEACASDASAGSGQGDGGGSLLPQARNVSCSLLLQCRNVSGSLLPDAQLLLGSLIFVQEKFCRVYSRARTGEIGRGSVERRVGRGKGVARARAERGGLPP